MTTFSSQKPCLHCGQEPVQGPWSELCEGCAAVVRRENQGPREGGICQCGRVKMYEGDDHDCTYSLGMDIETGKY